MHDQGAPISMGSPKVRSATTGAFHASDVRFPEHLSLPRHYHDDATFVVVLRGEFDRVSSGRRYSCTPGTVFSEPAGEPHSNVFGRSGAAVVIAQPVDASECCSPFELRPFVEPCYLRQPAVARLAAQLVTEVAAPDGLSRLAIDGLLLQMLALAGRGERHGPPGLARRPAWLDRVVEMAHEEPDRRLTLRAMSDAVGVHPAHLARAFRKCVGVSLANYARTVRLAAAADALASSRRPIVEIAIDAGFADQSHFTRAFRAYSGVTPAKYRAAIAPTRR